MGQWHQKRNRKQLLEMRNKKQLLEQVFAGDVTHLDKANRGFANQWAKLLRELPGSA